MTKLKILKQIRGFCVDCLGGRPSEVMFCQASDCKLFGLRMGKDPTVARKVNLDRVGGKFKAKEGGV